MIWAWIKPKAESSNIQLRILLKTNDKNNKNQRHENNI